MNISYNFTRLTDKFFLYNIRMLRYVIEFWNVLSNPIWGIALTVGLDLIRLYNVCLKKFFVHSVYCLFCFYDAPNSRHCDLSAENRARMVFSAPYSRATFPAARTPGGDSAADRAHYRRAGPQDPSGRTIVFIIMSGSLGSLPLAGQCQGVEEPGQKHGLDRLSNKS